MSAASEYRALFVVFEGIDGAGTTTQSELLAGYIQDMGVDVVRTREPGGTPLGERLRDLVLDPATGELDGMTELMLLAASRSHHVHTLIRPSLENDKPVICDRYTASSVAYQGHGRGVDIGDVGTLNDLATGHCRPDLTVLLDLPLEVASKRAEKRSAAPDRLELETDAFKRRVAAAYRGIAEEEPERCFVVDGTDDPQRILTSVKDELVRRWSAFPFRQR